MNVPASAADGLKNTITIPERFEVDLGFANESIPSTGGVQLQRAPIKAEC